jgi:hypothetical protein
MSEHKHRWRRIKPGEQSEWSKTTATWKCTFENCYDPAAWCCGRETIDHRINTLGWCSEGRCAAHAPKPSTRKPATFARWSIDGRFALCFDGEPIFYLASAQNVSGIPVATLLVSALNAARVVLPKARKP